MKEQISTGDLIEIKRRAEALAAFQMGATLIPIGILWLCFGAINFLYIVERQFALFENVDYRIILHLVQGFLVFATAIGTTIAFLLQYYYYSRKFGTWVPSLCMQIRNVLMFVAIMVIFLLILIVHYWQSPTFPWLGLAFGVTYSLLGVTTKPPHRWYAVAIALIMMGVSFLPFLLGGDGLWTRIACFGACGLTQVLTGWIDHRNLMRIHHSLTEVPDGKSV